MVATGYIILKIKNEKTKRSVLAIDQNLKDRFLLVCDQEL